MQILLSLSTGIQMVPELGLQWLPAASVSNSSIDRHAFGLIRVPAQGAAEELTKGCNLHADLALLCIDEPVIARQLLQSSLHIPKQAPCSTATFQVSSPPCCPIPP